MQVGQEVSPWFVHLTGCVRSGPVRVRELRSGPVRSGLLRGHALTLFIFGLIPFGQVLAAKAWKSNQICLIQFISILYFWSSGLVTLIPFWRVLAAKDWKSNQICLIQFFSILYFWSSGLVTLIPFWRVLAAKDWKSNRICLIQFISTSIILIFWFGDFDSFLTGFGCQRLKK